MSRAHGGSGRVFQPGQPAVPWRFPQAFPTPRPFCRSAAKEEAPRPRSLPATHAAGPARQPHVQLVLERSWTLLFGPMILRSQFATSSCQTPVHLSVHIITGVHANNTPFPAATICRSRACRIRASNAEILAKRFNETRMGIGEPNRVCSEDCGNTNRPADRPAQSRMSRPVFGTRKLDRAVS